MGGTWQLPSTFRRVSFLNPFLELLLYIRCCTGAYESWLTGSTASASLLTFPSLSLPTFPIQFVHPRPNREQQKGRLITATSDASRLCSNAAGTPIFANQCSRKQRYTCTFLTARTCGGLNMCACRNRRKLSVYTTELILLPYLPF